MSKWAGSIGGEHRQDTTLGRLGGEVYAGLDASFRSACFADAAVSQYSRLPAYQLVNLRAGFESKAVWKAFVSLKNAFNEKYVQSITIVSGNSGLVVGTPGDRRTFAVTLRARH